MDQLRNHWSTPAGPVQREAETPDTEWGNAEDSEQPTPDQRSLVDKSPEEDATPTAEDHLLHLTRCQHLEAFLEQPRSPGEEKQHCPRLQTPARQQVTTLRHLLN
uniref:Uncharacterized protein n=1 Tax=Micrurus lemniscatus lemniscatus TaxID=129467 RepID=A0A2D4JJ85_MICLE